MLGKKIFYLFFGVMFVTNIAQGQDTKKVKVSAFTQTIDILSQQVEKQIQDRDKLVLVLANLGKTLKEAELERLDNSLARRRSSQIERESLLMAEILIEQSENFTIKTELIDFLKRVVVRDQQLYDDNLEKKSALRFQLNKQLAKIRAEQTLLKTIQRDLQKLKLYPSKKENFKFFLESASKLLSGLNSTNQSPN